jgi:5-methylcytosine-specific restriction protein B
MSLQPLVDLVLEGRLDRWTERNQEAFDALFGSPEGRYRAAAKAEVTLRAPAMTTETGIPFAAYIHPSNPRSGPYSGLSFVLFPVEGSPCLIGLVVGTQGLAPDEAILGRPGHGRKVRAICDWLNSGQSAGGRVAWAKQDPTRTDIAVPDDIRRQWPEYKPALDRYGKEIYAIYRPSGDRVSTLRALGAFLDLMFEERGHEPMASAAGDAGGIRAGWFSHLMPSADEEGLGELMEMRRYVILQGPPGTGKTRMALNLLKDVYAGRGNSIQFHPNTTYENFVGGLAPVENSGDLGLRFAPVPGSLMRAAAAALEEPTRPYLLHVDEINRADLSKILGEAIFLLEAGSEGRVVELPYDFGAPFHRQFFLPPNLHLLGTMNSADRSIALLDVAVRRRFAFVSLWPSLRVVEQYGGELMQRAYRDLISHFIEHASDDAFALVPGHSYFLGKEDAQARRSLQTNLAPLLEEYLAQGYVSGFAEPLRSYLQWLRAL